MSADTNYETLRTVMNVYRPEGWAVEFGVYTGLSLGLIAERMPVIGFDSFKGLPEDWRPGFGKGKFRPRFPALPHHPNAMIVPGWFSETVPGFPFPPLGLVHIDCDLYSSTVTALDGVAGSIGVGTIIVFDEFHGYDGWEDHEARAWNEFCDDYQIEREQIGVGPEELAVRITGMGKP